MKLLQEADEATSKRKLIKSQLEKRRRERMNRSLERLRTMLLQEPQQVYKIHLFLQSQRGGIWLMEKRRLLSSAGLVVKSFPLSLLQAGTQHRAEKAEILEHTVFFLHKNAKEHKEKTGGPTCSFQDGFSSCLQRASQFLGPEGKGLWLGPVLDATFSARFTRSDSHSADAWIRTSISITHTKSLLQMLRLRSRSGQRTQASGASTSAQICLTMPQRPQGPPGLQMGAERAGSKESSAQSGTLSQTLWRPWP
uniref:Transcription factor HES-7.1-A-like n=1 Tax=Fundulus heteroclitus TaxID=8078 RepID=A0A3Q2QRJ3_FUNHE